jgi:hypothetical protein
MAPQKGVVGDMQPVTNGWLAHSKGSGDVGIIDNVAGILAEQRNKLTVAITIKTWEQCPNISQQIGINIVAEPETAELFILA